MNESRFILPTGGRAEDEVEEVSGGKSGSNLHLEHWDNHIFPCCGLCLRWWLLHTATPSAICIHVWMTLFLCTRSRHGAQLEIAAALDLGPPQVRTTVRLLRVSLRTRSPHQGDIALILFALV